MTKKAIFFITFLIIIFSSISAYGGYFYGTLATKNKAEIEKEAAIKGVIFEAREKLTEEAISKAQENFGGDTEKKEALDFIKKYYSLINEKNLNEAWELLSADYKKSLYSSYGLRKDFPNAKEIRVENIEFRTEGQSDSLYSVKIKEISTNNVESEKEYFIRINFDTLRNKWSIDGIEKKENQTKNSNN